MHRFVAIVLMGAAAPLAAAQESEPPRRNLKELMSQRVKRGTVTAVANEIGLLVISIGEDDGVAEGAEFEIIRKDESVASIVVNRRDHKWSAGKVVQKKTEPRVGDVVCSGSRFTDEQRKSLLDHAFSFRPLKDEDYARVRAVLADLESDDIAVREKSVKVLGMLEGPASSVLRSLDPANLGAEVRARVQDALKELDRFNRMVQSPGLESDIEFLAVIDDPRGYERLKSILSGVRPFSVAGFPEKGAGLAEYLTGWWAYSKGRVRWNARDDRFEDR
jgi:hypothetical protein